ncbi:MAG TPA: PKD domain-containing protein, partial [Conexibacter sp.]|nr:PKD domain-containing protein [Conexibacter sp.]
MDRLRIPVASLLAVAALLAVGSAGASAACTTAVHGGASELFGGSAPAENCGDATVVLRIDPDPATPALPVTVDASGSDLGDATGQTVTYVFDWGDGSPPLSSPNASEDHVYARGRYLGSVTIVDGASRTLGQTDFDLIVSEAPSARLSVPSGTMRPGVAYDFDATGSDAPGGSIASYEWNWGDGTTSSTSTPRATHTFANETSRAVSVTIVNDLGQESAPASDAVTVHDELPLVQLVATPATIAVGQQLTLDATGSTDPDGWIVGYQWDLDADGSYETSTATPTVTAGPYPNPGPIVLSVKVTDDSGRATVKSVLVNVAAPGGGGGTGGSGGGGGGGGA